MSLEKQGRFRTVTALSTFLASALSASGCMPAPGPSGPPQGELQIGADYRPSAVNRWVCASDGSIVLARRGNDFVLHLENLDWVLRGKDAGDFVSFGYSTFSGTVSMVGVGWTTTKLNQGETVYLASKANGGELVIKRASAKGAVDEKCALAAKGAVQ